MAVAPASTEADVASGACRRVGEPPLVSLDDATHRARVCKAEFGNARRATLRRYPWNFATAWRLLDGGEEVEAGEFKYLYPLDSDVVRVLAVKDLAEDEWEVIADEGGFLIGLATDAVDPTVKIILDITDFALWDALALRLLKLDLAALINPSVGKDKNLTAEITEEAKELTPTARRVDAQEKARSKVNQETSWLRARRVGGR